MATRTATEARGHGAGARPERDAGLSAAERPAGGRWASLGDVRARIDRAWYRAQQWGLLVPLALGNRALRRLSGHEPPPDPSPEESRAIERRYKDLLERDLAHVEAGIYPRSLLFQMPLGHYLRHLPEALFDIPRVISRRRRRDHKDLPPSVDLERYPSYFRRTFHWQSDGYLSERSARLYDASVEFLFAGTADVMRRMAIPPVVDAVRGVARPRVIDLGAGTGRYLCQLAEALPDAHFYALDLSPYYLKEAARVLAHVPDVSFLAENAERVPLQDGQVDVAVSVFLFHELPPAARRNVCREAFRLLPPGGRFVVLDSAQPTDGAEIRSLLDAFPVEYHEPYFKGYLQDDLGALLEECGFEAGPAVPCFLSKLVVGRKPA